MLHALRAAIRRIERNQISAELKPELFRPPVQRGKFWYAPNGMRITKENADILLTFFLGHRQPKGKAALASPCDLV